MADDPRGRKAILAEEITSRIHSKEEYKIGQEVNLKLGLVKGERFSISGRILNKTEEKENFKYGLQFTYFDNEQQAKLNHFIDSLALDSYKEREQDKQKKKIALGVGGAGFSGFAGGFAAAIILFGGFYFFKGYNTSKNQKTITITQEGKSYNISRHNLFEGNVKGLPKKLGKKVSSAYKA